VINDLGLSDEGRDLVVQDHASNLQRIKETHCKLDELVTKTTLFGVSN